MTIAKDKFIFWKHTKACLLGLFLCVHIFTPTVTTAQDKLACAPEDHVCLFDLLQTTTGEIDNKSWRDKTYREIAKLLTKQKKANEAISLIDKIESGDTRALTIRGIGMAAAETDLTDEEFDRLFIQLREKAEQIEPTASHAIALTYIAMAQAYAGDNDGAMQTAQDMENDSLRNKAYAESAEIQAEKDELDAAFASINAIEDNAFRNKAYKITSAIFAKKGNYDYALKTAEKIENTYEKAQAILYILVQQIDPEEVSIIK